MFNVHHSETLTEIKTEVNKSQTTIAAICRSKHVKIALVF
jgi:hypothetical protein